MNRQEYADFERRFETFMRRNYVEIMAQKDSEADPYFSWTRCDCCDRTLAGNRYAVKCITDLWDKEEDFDASICTDCLYYNECGRLDDETMMSIEE